MTKFLTPVEELAKHIANGGYAVMFVPDPVEPENSWGKNCKGVMLRVEDEKIGAYELRYWNMFPFRRFFKSVVNYEDILIFVKSFTEKTPAIRFEFFSEVTTPVGVALIPYREQSLVKLKGVEK